MSVNGKIAEYILRAQNASDGGKGIDEISSSRKAITDNRSGYSHKDPAIIAAIKLINSGKSNWKYIVQECHDYYNMAWIVYFETRIEGKKIQCSFHTFNWYFDKYTRNSYRTKWDHGSSRESALLAYNYYCNGYYAK